MMHLINKTFLEAHKVKNQPHQTHPTVPLLIFPCQNYNPTQKTSDIQFKYNKADWGSEPLSNHGFDLFDLYFLRVLIHFRWFGL